MGQTNTIEEVSRHIFNEEERKINGDMMVYYRISCSCGLSTKMWGHDLKLWAENNIYIHRCKCGNQVQINTKDLAG